MTFVKILTISLLCYTNLIDCQTKPKRVQFKNFFNYNIKVDYTTCNHPFYSDNEGDEEYQSDSNYEADDYEYDDGYDDDVYDDEMCLREDIPSDTYMQKYPGVASCCDVMGYMSDGKCEGTHEGGGSVTLDNFPVCHDKEHTGVEKGQDDFHYNATMFDCHKLCSHGAWKSDLLDSTTVKKNEATGKWQLFLSSGEIMNSFCLTYACSDSNEWAVKYSGCLCSNVTLGQRNDAFKTSVSLITNKTIPPLCCNNDSLLDVNRNECVDEDMVLLHSSNTECSGAWECDYREKMHRDIIEIKDTTRAKVVDNALEDAVCIGAMKGHQGMFNGIVKCHPACNGQTPCFASCTAHNKAWNETAKGYDDKIEANKIIPFSELLELDLDPSKENSSNIDYDTHHVFCSMVGGEYKEEVLFPRNPCRPGGNIKFLQNGDMELLDMGVTLTYRQFCVERNLPNATDMNGDLIVRACIPPKPKNEKFRFYYIIMSLSIVSLIITIMVYGFFRKALLRSDYNKMMMNFALSLLFAFLLLVIIQRYPEIQETNNAACVVVGHLNIFFFLSTFVWMTIMSYVIFDQIHGMRHVIGPKGHGYMIKVGLVGYGLPALIVILMLIVELTTPKCSLANASIGENSCLFWGREAKFIWFLGPILLMLLINTGMFAFIAFHVYKNQKSNAVVDTVKAGKRKEKLDRILLYLRLFLGMGIIWYFEVLAFALNTKGASQRWTYFADVLNMLQGVWVFLTFVCKRNVFQVVSMKSDRLYSVVLNRSKSSQNKGTMALTSRSRGGSVNTGQGNNRISATEMVSLSLNSMDDGKNRLSR